MALQCPFELAGLRFSGCITQQNAILDVPITEYPTQVLKGLEKMKNVNLCPSEEGMGKDKTKKRFLKRD